MLDIHKYIVLDDKVKLKRENLICAIFVISIIAFIIFNFAFEEENTNSIININTNTVERK
jgi:hypothetical protein